MRRTAFLLALVSWVCVTGVSATRAGSVLAQGLAAYRIEETGESQVRLRDRFTAPELAILEKLNRADLEHLDGLRELVIPNRWVADELTYSPLPRQYPAGAPLPKLLVVHVPGQMFGAYEFGTLVRWGGVSTGGRATPSQAGLFFLNWRSPGRTSTVNPDWFMQWYFNFDNREGFAFHEYALPGTPASHGCIRILRRDSQWLFEWGDGWRLDASGTRVVRPGTPVFVVGRYDFDAAPPWRSPAWLAQGVELPPMPGGEQPGPEDR